MDWYEIFRVPDFYLQNIVTDTEIEKHFKYKMPDDVRMKFSKSLNINYTVYQQALVACCVKIRNYKFSGYHLYSGVKIKFIVCPSFRFIPPTV